MADKMIRLRRYTMATATNVGSKKEIKSLKRKAETEPIANRTKMNLRSLKISEQTSEQPETIGGEGSESFFAKMAESGCDMPALVNFNGVEISSGLQRKVTKKGVIIDHFSTNLGSIHGYISLEPGVVKCTCTVSVCVRFHVIYGPVTLIVKDAVEKLPLGCMVTIPVGTKYALRNDTNNMAVIFFYHQPGDPSLPASSGSHI